MEVEKESTLCDNGGDDSSLNSGNPSCNDASWLSLSLENARDDDKDVCCGVWSILSTTAESVASKENVKDNSEPTMIVSMSLPLLVVVDCEMENMSLPSLAVDVVGESDSGGSTESADVVVVGGGGGAIKGLYPMSS